MLCFKSSLTLSLTARCFMRNVGPLLSASCETGRRFTRPETAAQVARQNWRQGVPPSCPKAKLWGWAWSRAWSGAGVEPGAGPRPGAPPRAAAYPGPLRRAADPERTPPWATEGAWPTYLETLQLLPGFPGTWAAVSGRVNRRPVSHEALSSGPTFRMKHRAVVQRVSVL